MANGMFEMRTTMKGSPVLDRLLHLAAVLRDSGVDVAVADVLDAGRALAFVDLADRSIVRIALRASLVKRETDLATFDRAFDVVFPASPPRPATDVPPDAEPAPGPAWASRLAAELSAAAVAGDPGAISDLAARAVALFGASESSERQAVHRILRALDVTNLLAAALRQLRADGASTLELAVRRHEIAAALESFRRALAAEVARRRAAVVEIDGWPELADSVIDRPIATLSAAELAELRRTLAPLARQLAARVRRRRRAGPGERVDVRRTVRRSLQTGGLPFDVATRRPHRHRPDVVLLCDVSGSVAEFARFTFALASAAHDVLARLRSFAFVGGVAEVTDIFATAVFDVPVQRLVERRGVVGLDGHSDYGEVFRQFARDHMDTVGPRTTLIVTGDARSNFRQPGLDTFAAICQRAHRVYWLDPEPRSDWDVDDSMIGAYGAYCDGVFEVATVRQLAAVIADLT